MAINQPKLTNIYDVKDWFILQGFPFFKLFSGATKGRQVLVSNPDKEDVEEACELLLHWVGKYANGGYLTLVVADNIDKLNNGPQTKIEFANNNTNTNSAIGAMQGYGNGQFIPGIGSVTPAVDQYIKEKLASEKEKWDLRQEIDVVKARLDNPDSATERAIGYLESNPNLVTAVLSKFLGISPGQLDPANIAGTPGETLDEKEQGEMLTSVLERIDTVFPDQAIHVLNKVADFIVSNPLVAKSYFKL